LAETIAKFATSPSGTTILVPLNDPSLTSQVMFFSVGDVLV